MALQPSLGVATGNTDGLSATCEPIDKRGWERRFEHSIIIVNGQGNLVDEWPHLDELFKKGPCGRGPHQIKISPYDPEKHVWIIDDQLHVIYRFTYDGKLVHTLGQLGVRGRGPNTFDRPTDIAWLPDGTYFISDGYGGKRVAKFGPDDKFIMDWGQAPTDPTNPGPNEFNTVHSIAITPDHKLYVVDRGHQRMQVFDENGKFLDMWPLRSPHWPDTQGTLMVNHLIDDKGAVWVGELHDSPDAQVRSERQLPVRLGRSGAAGRPPVLFARHHHRSAGQSVRGRLHGRAGAEVRADSRRRPGPHRGAAPANVGYHEVRRQLQASRGRQAGHGSVISIYPPGHSARFLLHLIQPPPGFLKIRRAALGDGTRRRSEERSPPLQRLGA